MNEILYLSAGDVEKVRLEPAAVIPLVESALRAHEQGMTENPPKIGIHTRPDAFIHAMPGFLREPEVAGVKCIAGYPENSARGLPHLVGVLLLHDPDTGMPYALMECGWVTAARTAAATALFVRECAASTAEVMGLLGAGVQARAIVPAVWHARPGLKRVVVYDPNPAAVDRLVSGLRAIRGAEIVVAAGVREAVEAADVVIAAAGPVERPLTRNEWFRSAALLVAVGYGFGEDAMRYADRLVTSDAAQMAVTAVALLGLSPSADGRAELPEIHAELGAILLGRRPGRTRPTERIFAYNTGLTIFDLPVGRAVFEAAVAANVGRRLPLF